MNSAAPGISRRALLTRLFPHTSDSEPTTGLQPVEAVRRHGDGVLWASLRLADDNIFVAGDDGILLHFDGQQWSPESFPSSLPIHSLCNSGERIYSVGWLGEICERVNGQWLHIQGGQSEPATINQPLFDIARDERGHLWAVGDQGRVVEFDGCDWREHNCGSNGNLRAVLPLADERVLVAGNGGCALLFAEGHWRELATGTGCAIVSMAALEDGSVIAVGGEYSIDDGAFRGRLFSFSDEGWQSIEPEQPLPRLRRVRRTAASLLICGDEGTAFRWTAEGVRRLPCRLRYDLHDIACLEDGSALICGDGGTVLRETEIDPLTQNLDRQDRRTWQTLSQGETNRTLRSIWPVGEDSLIAAGDGGTILHIEGDTLRLRTTPDQLRIHSIWGSSARNIFAACDNATILHFDGETWTTAHRGGVDTALLAIAGFGPHDIFAVGDAGYALRYDGLMWRQVETAVKQELYGLWGHDSQHLLAVGGGGLILRWNGEHWKSFSAGTDQDLYGVCGSGLEKLFIAGLAGTLIRFQDNAWHRDFTGVRSDLHAVAGGADAFYAAGSNGTILRNSDGIWEPEDSGCDNTLQALAVTDNTVYAVGTGGVVLKRRRDL